MASLSNINGLFDVHSTGAILFSTSHGTSGQILKSNGNAAPTWVDASTVIGGPYLPLTGGTLTGATATASGISFTVGGTLSGSTATFTGLVSGITPTAAANFATKAYVDAHPGSGGTVTGTGTATQVAFWDGTSSISGNDNLYWDSTNDHLGIGDSTPGSRLKVASGVSETSIYTVDINHVRNDPDVATHAMRLNVDLSGADNTTADRTNSALLIDIDSSANGDISNEHRIYGVNSDVKFSGFSDLVRGGYFLAESNYTGAKTAQLAGVYGYAIHDANDAAGGVSNMYGVFGLSSIQDTGDVDNAYGVYGLVSIGTNRVADVGVTKAVAGEITIDKDTAINYGTMIGISSVIDNNEGSVPNFGSQYLFKGDYQGTKGAAAWGIYTEGDKNYFEGNVGIGVTSPAEKLHVNSGTGNIPALFESTDNLSLIIFKDNNTTTDVGIGADDNDEVFYAGGSERIRIDSSGNVGIGTTSPTTKLHVVGANNTTAFKVDFPSADFDFSANSTSGYTTSFHMDDTGTYIGSNSAGRALIFQTNDTDRLYINGNTGNVGIGTTSPSQKLHIHNSATLTATYQKFTNGTATTGTTLGIDADGDFLINNGEAKEIKLYTNDTQRLTIQSGGNVGIGTATPVAKLDVSGSVQGTSFYNLANPSPIMFPDGGTFNGSSSHTGNIVIKLPDTGGVGVNNMMTCLVRIFDYATSESFDVRFNGYFYGDNFLWTRTAVWIDSSANIDRNFTVRFGKELGGSGTQDRAVVTIGEGNSTWSYPKVAVIQYTPGHSEGAQPQIWNSGWNVSVVTDYWDGTDNTLDDTITNNQVNNWRRNGQSLYYGSGTGNVGIGTTSPAAKLQSVQTTSGEWTGGFKNYTSNGYGLRVDMSGSSSVQAALQVYTGSGTGFVVKNSGVVGIGTFTPGAKLEISGIRENQIRLTSYDTTAVVDEIIGGVEFYTSDISAPRVSSFITSKFNSAFGDSYLSFGTSTGVGAATERMRINSAGNIIIKDDGNIYASTNNSTVNSGIYFGGSDNTLRTYTNDTERMRITSNGNIVIGGGSAYSGTGVTSLTVNNDLYPTLALGTLSANRFAILAYSSYNLFASSNNFVFNSGNVGIGTTSPSAPLQVHGQQKWYTTSVDGNELRGFFNPGGSGDDAELSLYKADGATQGVVWRGTGNSYIRIDSTVLKFINFYYGINNVGQIVTGGTNVLYQSNSDYRLKENVTEMTGALDRVSQLKPSRYNFISHPETQVDGFMAHELQEVVPQAVSGQKDEMNEDGTPKYQGVDHSQVVPLLVGAIKELEARVKELENK